MKPKNNRTGILCLTIALCFGPSSAWSFTYDASNGFEDDTGGWTSTTRVGSGTNGIISAVGSFHGTVASGAFTQWGGYSSVFPTGGYTTSVRVYLNPTAVLVNDTRFSFTSAVNTPAGAHRRDFGFNAAFYNDNAGLGAGTSRILVNVSSGVGRGNSNPKDAQVMITAAGWYTFEHTFRDNGSGVLAVDLTVKDASDQVVGTPTTLSNAADLIGTTVGGNRYGWFQTNEFSGGLPVDSAKISSNRTPTIYNVTKSTGHLAISSAIAEADPTNVINVGPGTYKENVIVNKSISIKGPNAGVAGNGVRGPEAIVQPATIAVGSGEIFHVTASNVTIDGLTIDGDNAALNSGILGTNGADLDAAEGVTVYVNNVNNLSVVNNIVKNLSYTGVNIFGVSGSSPATSGHVITGNLIKDLGTYDVASGIANWGIGALLYYNQYAQVEDNVITNVRIGVQTGQYNKANPTPLVSPLIDGNSISARARGIFHNELYVPGVPFVLSNNSITALPNAHEVKVVGILLSALRVPSTVSDNSIDLAAVNSALVDSRGYDVWNVASDSLVTINGGSVAGARTGLFLNNYEGYNSNAVRGAHATVSGLAITGSTTGIRVLDSPSSTHAPVQLTLGTGVTVSGGAKGLAIEGTNASQTSIADLSLSGQSGNYIELINNAGDVDATSATFAGKIGSAMDLGELFAVEAKVLHKNDNPALGLVNWNPTFTPSTVVISDAQTPANLSIPSGTTVTITPTGSLSTGILNLAPGATIIVNEGDLAIGENTVISGTFTVFNSFGSWNINGDTTFNIGQSLALISDIHVAGGKTLTVNGGGELVLDGCVIDSQTAGTKYNITTATDGVLTMARNAVTDANINITTTSLSVPPNVVSRIYDNSFTNSAIAASDDAKVYHNVLTSTPVGAGAAFADVDGWGNVASAASLQNKFVLDFDAPAAVGRTLDANGNLFVQTGDDVAMRMDVSKLGTNHIHAAEALLGYNSTMLTPTGASTKVAPTSNWVVITETNSITPPSTIGMVDSALGLKLTPGAIGSSADETIARVNFTAANAGVTLGFFRVQANRVFNPDGSYSKDTRLTKSVAGLPSYLAAFTANTGELVIDNEKPVIATTPITGTQVQPSQALPVNVLAPSLNPVFRTSAPLVLTFTATDNGHGLSGLDAADEANDLVLYNVVGGTSTVIAHAGYSVTTSNSGGVITYTVALDVPAATPAGTYTVSGAVRDRSGNVSDETTLGSFTIANEAQVSVELQGFVGTTRDVTFVATGGVTASWTKPVTFSSSVGTVILENVPAGTTSISAKTNWTLRNKVVATSTLAGVYTANLTGASKLKAGDITGDNVINTLDYSVLSFNWVTTNPVSDMSGEGVTNTTDYTLMQSNFYTIGTPQ